MLDLQKMLRDAVAELDRETEQERREQARREERQYREAARVFLTNLDPNSQEGMWFEALAEKFPSRLEAAVVYLRDVKRS